MNRRPERDGGSGSGLTRAGAHLQHVHAEAGENLRQRFTVFRRRGGDIRQGHRVTDRLIFRAGERVVGEQTDADKMAQPGEKPPGGGELLRRIVQPGNHRHADFDGDAGFVERAQIFENPFVAPSGQATVKVGIHRLDVIEKESGVREHRFERLPRHLAAGIHRTGNFLGVKRFEKLRAELRVEQRFAAGDGDSAAAFGVEDPVAEHFSQHRLDRHLLPVEGQRVEEARFDTAAAADAVLPVDGVKVPFDVVAGTDGGAGAAADALALPQRDFRFRADALRIVTPETAQRAPLQKHGGADSRSVMDGQMFDADDANRVHSCTSA